MFFLLTVSNNQFRNHESEFLTIKGKLYLILCFFQKQSDCLKVVEDSGFIILESIFGSGAQDIGLLTTLCYEFSNCF